MIEPTRTVSTVETTRVSHVCLPRGSARTNGPHLADLRAFVAACADMDDETVVRIQNGHLDEGGRRSVLLEVTVRVPAGQP